MSKEEITLLGKLVLAVAGFYIVHSILFSFLGLDTTHFEYSLQQLYLFFGVFSMAIILLLLKVRQKNLDIVGNTFLLATSVKMIVCYIVGRPILKSITQENSLEKWNFFILFVLFLMLETVVTIVILNKKKN